MLFFGSIVHSNYYNLLCQAESIFTLSLAGEHIPICFKFLIGCDNLVVIKKPIATS